jgi:hypothetical protein
LSLIFQGNNTIYALYTDKVITEVEHNILFENKIDWFKTNKQDEQNWNDSEDKCLTFWNTFKKIKILFDNNNVKNYNFTYIQFPDFYYSPLDNTLKSYNKDVDFSNSYFYGKTNFDDTTFYHNVKFNETKFYSKTSFTNTKFGNDPSTNNTDFRNSIFLDTVRFMESRFHCKTDFSNSTFHEQGNFNLTKFFNELWLTNISAESLLFKKSHIYLIHLEASRIKHLNFIDIKGLDINAKSKSLSLKNFYNKESARVIKSDFEKQNNITEANKYFKFEQDLYLHELLTDGLFQNIGTIFAVGLHKLISDSGTSWSKVLFWIITFSFIVLILHDYIPCWQECLTSKTECLKGLFSWDTLNRMVELINPANMFKNTNILYQDKEFIGMIVRIITLYLFYQFAMAFRQNTRRK